MYELRFASQMTTNSRFLSPSIGLMHLTRFAKVYCTLVRKNSDMTANALKLHHFSMIVEMFATYLDIHGASKV